MGERVLLLSTRRPSPLACRHDFAPEAIAETRYLYPPAISDFATWKPRGLSQALSYINELEFVGIRPRIRQYGLLTSAIQLLRWATQNRIEHVHCHSCADAAHVLALARRLGGPSYSLTLHGDLEVYGRDHRLKMKDAAFVCVVGDHLRQQVKEKVGLPDDRMIVTCMGVDSAELAKLGNLRAYTAGQLHVATVARLNPAKGHIHALAAVQRAHQLGLNIRYTIAGDGPHKEAVVAKVRELGLERVVLLAGSLSDIEVYRLLSEIDAFLLPSTGLGEAWPVSVMEAMGAGLPVIASVIGATPEMITSGQDGILVPQRDEDALLRNIMLLGTNVELRRKMGAAAQATASRRFDVSITAATLRNAIRATAGSQLGTDHVGRRFS